MKNILFLFIILFTSCEISKPPFVVSKLTSKGKEFQYELKSLKNTNSFIKIITKEKYLVGDTLYLIKK